MDKEAAEMQMRSGYRTSFSSVIRELFSILSGGHLCCCVCPSIYSAVSCSFLILVCFLFCFYIVASSFKFSSSPDSILKNIHDFSKLKMTRRKMMKRRIPLYDYTKEIYKATDTKRLFWAGQIQAHHKNKNEEEDVRGQGSNERANIQHSQSSASSSYNVHLLASSCW